MNQGRVLATLLGQRALRSEARWVRVGFWLAEELSPGWSWEARISSGARLAIDHLNA